MGSDASEDRVETRQLRYVLSALAVGAALLDSEFRYVMANPRLAGFLGMDAAEVAGQVATAALVGEDAPTWERHMAPVVEGLVEASHFEVRFERPVGQVTWLSVSASAIPHPVDSSPAALALFSDVTAARDAENAMADMARRDLLTGLANRNAFEERFALEWRRARRNGLPLSLLLADLDHFKGFNDTFGHQAGDRCLRTVGRTLAYCFQRATDFAARWGGEEFAILLAETDAAHAADAAEHLRRRLAEAAIPRPGSTPPYVTLSIGAATARPGRGGLPRDLLSAADAALYEAKSRGRDRICQAPRASLGSTSDDATG
jgi:diguanylate cyclase (GGDEF)-like protein/PAS domain S-box-containing protein